ncbi:MAG TPA: hypothetical protein PLJ58_01335 [bacterium]|nr:hypothetical protein [bacterium]
MGWIGCMIMMIAIGVISFIVFFVAALFFGSSRGHEEVQFTDSVEVVYYHEPGHYSFALAQKEDSTLVINDYSFDSRNMGGVKIFTDALPNNKAFIKRSVGYNKDIFVFKNYYNRLTEIHIHSAKDLKPADWNHGKFGSGQTRVIE